MTDAIRQKVLRIMELALLLNPTETQQKYTKNRPTVFVNFSGHTCQLDISVDKTGWPESCPTCGHSKPRDTYTMTIYLSRNIEYSLVNLDDTILYLESLYSEWKDKEALNG